MTWFASKSTRGARKARPGAGITGISTVIIRRSSPPGRKPRRSGSFLRSFTWGGVLRLGKVSRKLLAELARRANLPPGADVLAFIDVDSTQRRIYGHAKQGAASGHTKIGGKTVLVRGLNALAATVCTPQAAPVIAAARLRGGNASSARGAASLITEAAAAARSAR